MIKFIIETEKIDAYKAIIKEMTQYDNKVFEAVSKLVCKFKNLGYELSFSLIPLLSEGIAETVFQKDNTIIYKYIYSDNKEKVFVDFLF